MLSVGFKNDILTKGGNNIVWGIIGCGNVTEIKSGPAFQKCENSQLLAVMRRDADKVEDFAVRHKVPLWYNDYNELLRHDRINAVYIATPPSTHVELAIKSLRAGKNVYIEKPMTVSAAEASLLSKEVKRYGKKLVVAHYRRQLPMFLKIKEWLDDGKIGKLQLVDLKFFRHQISLKDSNWRLDPKVSGGTFFHDIAPHQLDLMYYFFGECCNICGNATHQLNNQIFVDIVSGLIEFENGLQFSGNWNFNSSKEAEIDQCIIYGSRGSIAFSTFGNEVKLLKDNSEVIETFIHPLHIQQPFIQKTVNYFLGKAPNPCSVEEGKKVMEIIAKFTKNQFRK